MTALVNEVLSESEIDEINPELVNGEAKSSVYRRPSLKRQLSKKQRHPIQKELSHQSTRNRTLSTSSSVKEPEEVKFCLFLFFVSFFTSVKPLEFSRAYFSYLVCLSVCLWDKRKALSLEKLTHLLATFDGIFFFAALVFALQLEMLLDSVHQRCTKHQTLPVVYSRGP